MGLTYNETLDRLDVKYIVASTVGYTLAPGIYELSDIILMLKFLLPKEVKVDITVDDLKLKSNLTTNKTIKFTRESFFCTILGFAQSRSGPLVVIQGFIQIIRGIYKSEKPFNITGFDKIDLKSDCIDGSIANGVREHILYSFARFFSPGRKIYKEPKYKLFKKVKKSILSHVIFI